jgi:hypothetical protein
MKMNIPTAEAIPNCGLLALVIKLYKNVIKISVSPTWRTAPARFGPPPVRK